MRLLLGTDDLDGFDSTMQPNKQVMLLMSTHVCFILTEVILRTFFLYSVQRTEHSDSLEKNGTNMTEAAIKLENYDVNMQLWILSLFACGFVLMINSIFWVNMKKNYLATIHYCVHITLIFVFLSKRLNFGKRVNEILPITQLVSFLFSSIFLCKAPIQSLFTMVIAIYSCFYYEIDKMSLTDQL